MTRKRHKPDEIVAKLRQVDVPSSQCKWVAEAAAPRVRRDEEGSGQADEGPRCVVPE
jgi:hypothetical protein